MCTRQICGVVILVCVGWLWLPAARGQAPASHIGCSSSAFMDFGDVVVMKGARLPAGTVHMACAGSAVTGRFYCFGGATSGNVLTDRIVEYDGGHDVILTKLATLPSPRYEVVAAASPATGKIYCFGGNAFGYYNDFDDILEYDPSADQLVVKNAKLASPRRCAGCAAYPATGRIYLFGGGHGYNTNYADVCEYSPSGDTLIIKSATLPSGRCLGGCAYSTATRKIYYLGGAILPSTYLDEILEYDPSADRLVTKGARLPWINCAMACAADPATGKIYCFGGQNSSGLFDAVVEYDPVHDRVTVMHAKLPSPRCAMGGAADPLGGGIYCFGGNDGTSQLLDETLEYLPSRPAPCQTARLTAADGAAGDLFGFDLAVDGDRLVAGAFYDDNEHGVDAGAAYVFRRHGIEWIQEARLTAWDGRAGSTFGYGVAIAGDRIAVGAPEEGWSGNGAVYTFRRAGSTWVPESKLLASDGQPNDRFGLYLALQGERLAVSAFAHSHMGPNSGALYVFEYDGSNWVQHAELFASDAQPNLYFGARVALDGARIATGAGDDIHGHTGAAYIFRYDGSNWNQEAKLTAENPAPNDYFYRVALEGEVVCVGADQRWGPGSGFVEVFRYNGTTFDREAHLTASDGQPGDTFATPALRGERLVVGAQQMVTVGQGAAYVFERIGGNWTEVAKLTASDAAPRDDFGYAVSLADDFVAIGAHQTQAGLPGKAYVFAVGGADCNHNGALDWCDIASGTSRDINHNSIPDECEPPTLSWHLRADTGPMPRSCHTLTYDSARAATVLFGGDIAPGQYMGDTWEWDGRLWTFRTQEGPPTRGTHAAAYDSERAVTVLFGGWRDYFLGDTWEWDGQTWALRSETGPDARRHAALAYDAARQVIVLFGGHTYPTVWGDTWEWDGNTWTLRATGGPPPRMSHGMVYDAARRVTVMFGGAADWSTKLADTWEWDGAVWTLRATTGPSPRDQFGLAYDAVRRRTVLFGGYDAQTQALNETWEWDGQTWTLLDIRPPPPRAYTSLAFDLARQRMVMFGGSVGPAFLGDTWELMTSLPGDLNCDGVVDFEDINPFVLALTAWGQYLQQYPDCDIMLADINGDAYVTFADIDPFVALLVGGA